MQIDLQRAQHKANQTADICEHYAKVSQEIRLRILDRLSFIRMTPSSIMDLGSSTGAFTVDLHQQYPMAQLYGLDFAEQRLQLAQKQDCPAKQIAADAQCIPLPNQSIQMIISNLCIHWCNDLPALFKEVYRVLEHNGLFFFSCLGPDSLKELKQAWAQIDTLMHVHPMLDMHDIGDHLLHTGYENPVVDKEHLEIQYQHPELLLQDLKASGGTNCLQTTTTKLYTPRHLDILYASYPRHSEGHYTATFEVIYGMAWKPPIRKTAGLNAQNEATIDIRSLFE